MTFYQAARLRKADVALLRPERYNDLPTWSNVPLETRTDFEGEHRFDDLDGSGEPQGRRPDQSNLDMGAPGHEHGFSHESDFYPSSRELINPSQGSSVMDDSGELVTRLTSEQVPLVLAKRLAQPRYFNAWIAPTGKEYEVRTTTHDRWALQEQGLTANDLLDKGWIRVVYPDNVQVRSLEVVDLNLLKKTLTRMAKVNTFGNIWLETDADNMSIPMRPSGMPDFSVLSKTAAPRWKEEGVDPKLVNSLVKISNTNRVSLKQGVETKLENKGFKNINMSPSSTKIASDDMVQLLYQYLKTQPLSVGSHTDRVMSAIPEALEVAGISDQEWEEALYNDGDLISLVERIDAVLTPAMRNNLVSEIREGSPADAPSWDYLEDAQTVKPDTWLVHFTDFPTDIKVDGFTKGVSDVERLGLTTWLPSYEKEDGGYIFAYVADSAEATSASKRQAYGEHAVLFRARGIKAYHNADGESQVIVWGPSVSPQEIIELRRNDDGLWSVEAKFNTRLRKKGRTAFSGHFEDCVRWVETNFQQYRRQIASDDAPQRILRWRGHTICLEVLGGETRFPGDKYEVTLPFSWEGYGYFQGITAEDGDSLDAIVLPGYDDDGPVFIAEQLDFKTQEHVQYKVIIGCKTTKQAKEAYLKMWPEEMLGEVVKDNELLSYLLKGSQNHE